MRGPSRIYPHTTSPVVADGVWVFPLLGTSTSPQIKNQEQEENKRNLMKMKKTNQDCRINLGNQPALRRALLDRADSINLAGTEVSLVDPSSTDNWEFWRYRTVSGAGFFRLSSARLCCCNGNPPNGKRFVRRLDDLLRITQSALRIISPAVHVRLEREIRRCLPPDSVGLLVGVYAFGVGYQDHAWGVVLVTENQPPERPVLAFVPFQYLAEPFLARSVSLSNRIATVA